MRVFWIVVGVLAVVAAVVVFALGDNNRSAETVSNGSQPAPANLGKEHAPAEMGAAPPAAAQNSSSQIKPEANDTIEPDATALVDDLLDSSNDQATGRSIDDALNDGGDGSALHATAAGTDAFDPSHPVDGKYIVAGAGTPAEPFEITWDLLLLASQTYQPRYGKSDIPPQVKAIDGKHIKIAGYFAFPLASTDARELLFMLNMWDGCCIGMPPSPYDAIEVRLSQPMAGGGKQWVNYGTLSGTIKVDPYVHEGWLLGMYLMEDGVVDVGM